MSRCDTCFLYVSKRLDLPNVDTQNNFIQGVNTRIYQLSAASELLWISDENASCEGSDAFTCIEKIC